jgi:NAD(P)-dependent dehydrogenase (short-subunit alcohol dehydrogenase family)
VREFKDRVAVVTGAASGIGRALSLALARRGAHVALVDVNEAGLGAVAGEVAALGRKASRHVADVANRARMAALPDEVLREHGRVSLLVNNAGVSVAGSFEEHSLDDFDWIVGINFWGVVHGCKFFLPHLRREPEAHIVNLSSMFGIVGIPGQISYCSTKYAVRGFSETLFTELREAKIGVTCVHPGGVKTNIVGSTRNIPDDARARTMERFDRMAIAPERAAEKIVRAVERNRMRVVICREAKIGDWLKRLAPTATQRLIDRAIRRVGPIA